MAVAFTNYTKNSLLDWWFRGQTFTVPATQYWRLYTANPAWDTGSGGTELAGGTGYTTGGNDCTAATFWEVASQGANGGYRLTNTGTTGGTDVTWTASADWSAITGVALWDSNAGGNMLAGGSWAADPGNGDTVRISSGAIDLDLDVSAKAGLTSWVVQQFLLKLGNLTPGTPPANQYVALYTVAPDIKDGSGGTEVSDSGTAYSRTQLTPIATAWDAASSQAMDNSAQIDWATATSSWGDVVASAVVDTASGAPTHYHAVDAFSAVTMDNGDDFYIAAGAFDLAFTDVV